MASVAPGASPPELVPGNEWLGTRGSQGFSVDSDSENTVRSQYLRGCGGYMCGTPQGVTLSSCSWLLVQDYRGALRVLPKLWTEFGSWNICLPDFICEPLLRLGAGCGHRG